MVLVLKQPFFQHFFLGNIFQENVFYDILKRRNAFLCYKNKKFKKLKGYIFPKGLTHGFGSKMAIFLTYFSFRQIGQENVFYDNLQRRNAFLGYKKKKTPFQATKRRRSNSQKIDIFPKGLTYGFGPKIAIFSTFFFQAIQARKISLMIFQNEKTPFQAIKTRSSISRKIDFFPNGLTHGFGPKSAIFPTFFFQAIQYRKMSFMIFYNEETPFSAIKTRSLKSRKLTFFQSG